MIITTADTTPVGRHHADLPAAWLQQLAASTWAPADQEVVAGWALRAAHGWTGRANSALVLGPPEGPLADALAALTRWYADRRLPPTLQVVEPDLAGIADQVAQLGWQRRHAGLVLTCPVEVVLARTAMTSERHEVRVTDRPDEQWTDAYGYRGGRVPERGLELLLSGPEPRFWSLLVDGEVASVARTSTCEGWTGLTAVETRPEYRRRGLAQAMLRLVATRGRESDAPDLWLGVDTDNTVAQRLYAKCGFTQHHRYDYWWVPA